MNLQKNRTSTITSMRKIIAHEHLNPNGVLFGGYLMCWMDEVAFMCARQFAGRPSCVTVNIDNITFRHSLKLGEQVLLTACVNNVGYSSMEIEVTVEKEDPETPTRLHTNSAHLTFVSLDKNQRPAPVPKLILESKIDELKNQESKVRVKVRKRISRFLNKKHLEIMAASEAKIDTPQPHSDPTFKTDILNHLFKRIQSNFSWVDSSRGFRYILRQFNL